MGSILQKLLKANFLLDKPQEHNTKVQFEFPLQNQAGVITAK